jgi:hypothetical protein
MLQPKAKRLLTTKRPMPKKVKWSKKKRRKTKKMAGEGQAPDLPPPDELARKAERVIERIHSYEVTPLSERTMSEKSPSNDPLTAMLDEAIDSGVYGKPTGKEE